MLALQTVLVVVLLVQNQRRRRAQTEAARQQAEITHAARLVLVGEMTASIAHEVNQPLSAILSNADAADMLLQREPVPRGEIRQILEDIRRDNQRAHEIVGNMRRLLSRRELRMESVDINQAVRTVLALTHSDMHRRSIAVSLQLDPALPVTAADPVHLQQVILNLVMNAMDAMRNIPVTERRLEVVTLRKTPRSAEIAVVDSGSGIAAEQITRIFDSFYTTKHEGMGLGLSIARVIVQSHGGTIWAENNPERPGATFRFTLPLAA